MIGKTILIATSLSGYTDLPAVTRTLAFNHRIQSTARTAQRKGDKLRPIFSNPETVGGSQGVKESDLDFSGFEGWHSIPFDDMEKTLEIS